MGRSLLFNPGPTNVSDAVRSAIRTQDICHREPEFFEILKRVNENLVEVLGGEGTHSSVLFVASGTGCNEAVMSSVSGKVLVLNNGKYSDRICDILGRYGIHFSILKMEPLLPMDLRAVEKVLKEDDAITHIAVVHHETTTGVLAPLRKIGEVAKRYGKLLIVDGISSIGGHSFHLQMDNVAFCTVSANKCLEGFPGISFVVARTDEIKKMKGRSRSFYFDLYAQWKKGLSGETPFTPAVQVIFAFDVALKQIIEEGYENRVLRYTALASRMRRGLENLGFELLLLPDEMQSNILTAVKMPKGMDYWRVHDDLKKRGITIYSDKTVLAQRKFRVATLGCISDDDVDWFLDNMKEVMQGCRMNSLNN